MSDKKYSVVNFVYDNTSEFVPTKWIVFEGDKAFVRFPNQLSSEANALRRDPLSSPKDNWPSWEVKVIKGYRSLRNAEEKAERYKDDSDIESSAVEGPPAKRTRTRESASAGPTLILNPPSGNLFDFSGATPAPSTTADATIEVTDGTPSPSSPSHVQFQIIPDPSGGNSQMIVTTFATEETLQLMLSEQRAYQQKSLENQEILIRGQLEVKSLLVRSLSSRATEGQTEPSMFGLIPIKSSQDLERMEGHLGDKQSQLTLIEALCRFGRTEISKTTGDILSYLFEVKFSREIRLTNTSGKLSFADRRLCACVRGAIQQTHPEFKVKDINSRIGSWLRGSIDRGGGRKERHGHANPNREAQGSSSSGNSSSGNQVSEADNTSQQNGPIIPIDPDSIDNTTGATGGNNSNNPNNDANDTDNSNQQ